MTGKVHNLMSNINTQALPYFLHDSPVLFEASSDRNIKSQECFSKYQNTNTCQRHHWWSVSNLWQQKSHCLSPRLCLDFRAYPPLYSESVLFGPSQIKTPLSPCLSEVPFPSFEETSGFSLISKLQSLFLILSTADRSLHIFLRNTYPHANW